MSATDQQVPASDAEAPEVQGSAGSESNTPSIISPQPNAVGEEPTQLPPEMENFYAIVGLPNSEFGTMVEAGFLSPGDLVYFDKAVVDQLSIRLSSKARLKNYIKWRDQYLGFTTDDLEYITVSPDELANVRRESMSGPSPRVTGHHPSLDVDRDLERRQTITNTQAIEAIAEKLISKGEKSFREKFKNNKDLPGFDGSIYGWSTWKRHFIGFLGTNNLESLLEDPVTDERDPKYDPEDQEKSTWLYHVLQQKLHKTALTYLTGMPKDGNGIIIPDGQGAWQRICQWYEGPSARAAMSRYAHNKIRSLWLTKNCNAWNYLSTMNEMFSMLEDAKQPMYNDAKVAALLDGIEDNKYDVLKQIIYQDYNVTYEEVLGKL